MDKKTKYYLKNIIKESLSTDVDEMAKRPKGTRYVWGDPKSPPFKYRPVWDKDNPTNPPLIGAVLQLLIIKGLLLDVPATYTLSN